jgi:hypothetical protein
MYRNLGGSYQSPKTIQIYSQQAHGNTAALPRDTWVETFFIWPLAAPLEGSGIVDAFANSSQLGKVERLIWIAAQARKVHSSACDDTLWCLKYGAEGNKEPRGANPFSCRMCLESVRNACPAYAVIAPQEMVFNRPGTSQQFRVDTSAGDNTTLNQRFNKCEGTSLGVPVVDTYSPVDERDTLAFYPKPGHSGEPLTVSEFISRY